MPSSEPDTGIDTSVVEQMSRWKGEPGWMADLRLRALRSFGEQPMAERSASGVPDIDVSDLLDHLALEVDRHDPASVTTGHGPTGGYQDREGLEEQGILFCDLGTALREHLHVVEKYFGTIVAPDDGTFAALNTAVWSGGSFLYVPPGVTVEMPLQVELRADDQGAGQFKRTLIIADEGSGVHFIDGCSAPVYTNDILHASVVEIVVKANAHVTYTTIQNWSPNVCNLVTERARVETGGHIEWIDGNIGSRVTMKCPEVHLVGDGASGAVLSVSSAGRGQRQDVGAEVVHAAPNTSSKIISRSISSDGGVTISRGLVRVEKGATGTTSQIDCGALLLDEQSRSTAAPAVEIGEPDAQVGRDATVSRISEEQRFYLMSRGLSDEQAVGLIANGFVELITSALPLEYAVEWSRLIELQIDGSIG